MVINWTRQHEAEYTALCAVARAAQELVTECKGADVPPSLGALAKLESALAVDWAIRFGNVYECPDCGADLAIQTHAADCTRK